MLAVYKSTNTIKFCSGKIMTLGERLREAREKKGLSQEDLAKLTGVSQQTIQKIESGDAKKTSYILELAAAVDEDPFYLKNGVRRKEGGQNGYDNAIIITSELNAVQIPLLELDQVEPWLEGTLSTTPRNINMHFTEKVVGKETLLAVLAEGDAMESPQNVKSSICDSDIVVFNKSLIPKPNDTILVKIDGSMKIRQYTKDGTQFILKALNSQYPPQPFTADTMIVGVKIGIIRHEE